MLLGSLTHRRSRRPAPATGTTRSFVATRLGTGDQAPHEPRDGTGTTPTPSGVPRFPPLPLLGGRWYRLRRLLHRRRRLLTAALGTLALAVAATAVTMPGDDASETRHPQAVPGRPTPDRPSGRSAQRDDTKRSASPLVSAPVRIHDAATVRLLHPGDRVDVLASPSVPAAVAGHHEGTPTPGETTARLVAQGARVAAIPEPPSSPAADDSAPESLGPEGALVVLTVPRTTARALTGAAVTSQLSLLLR